MPTPILAAKKLLLFKMEASEGVDPTPTGGANAILVSNFSLKPMEGQDVPRNLIRPYIGNDEQFPVGLYGRMQFKVELAGSGAAGTAPGWGPMARCGGLSEAIVASTSVTYTPITDSMESGAAYVWEGATKQILTNIRGDATLRYTAASIPYLECDFMGVYSDPAEVSIATPTYTAFKKPLIVNKANTTFALNGVSLVLRELSLAIKNKVEPRMLVGSERIVIDDRKEELAMQVEAVPVSIFNPYTLAKAQTQMAMSLVHGTVAGSIITLSSSTLVLKRPTGSNENQGINEWPLVGLPLPSSGNDQWSLALT